MGPATIVGNTITGTTRAAIGASQATGQVTDNVLSDNVVGISWSGEGGLVANNTISGGATGIIVGAGTSTVEGNTVENAENKGMLVYPSAVAELSGNILCGRKVNLEIRDGAEVADDGTDEVCGDATAE